MAYLGEKVVMNEMFSWAWKCVGVFIYCVFINLLNFVTKFAIPD